MEKKKGRFFRRPPGKKEIYLLPTTFTVLNLFFGFAAIVDAMKEDYFQAAGFLLLANICDGLDGRFARMMGAASAMGRELDSLADVVSFGVAPAVLIWRWAFSLEPPSIARLGWMVGFIFLAAAALRLARFNVDDESRPHFLGMPAPSASAVLATTVYFHPAPLGHSALTMALPLGMLMLAALMVSRVPFLGLKHVDTRKPRSYAYVLPIMLFIVLTAYESRYAFVLVSYSYLAGNLLAYARRRFYPQPEISPARSLQSGVPPEGFPPRNPE